MIRRPPRSTRTDTLFPYTTLFRSIYQSLLTYSFDLKPQPGLAKSWEISEDGLNTTFHLQEGVKWHDGKPFTADDVVFSLADMLPKVHARARVLLGTYVKSVKKIRSEASCVGKEWRGTSRTRWS